MKGFVLAALATAAYVAVVTAMFRMLEVRRRAAVMVRLWGVTVPLFVIVHLVTPADLWILPGWLTEPRPFADLFFGLFVYAAAFFGGILQVYNLADRGLSLRVLVDLKEAGRPLTAEAIMTAYSAGRGLRWMFAKRLQDLVEQGVVRLEGGRIEVTPAGRRAAALFRQLRAVVRLE